jgi:hypothetical protein
MSFIYLVDSGDEKVAKSLAIKLATEAKPGAIILLTTQEFKMAKTMHVVEIGDVIDIGVHKK